MRPLVLAALVLLGRVHVSGTDNTCTSTAVAHAGGFDYVVPVLSTNGTVPFLYAEIPKCASTLLRSLLYDPHDPHGRARHSHDAALTGPHIDTRYRRRLPSRPAATRPLPAAHYAVVVVREPLERLVSAYGTVTKRLETMSRAHGGSHAQCLFQSYPFMRARPGQPRFRAFATFTNDRGLDPALVLTRECGYFPTTW